MSVVMNIKGLILSDYKGPPEVKKALLNLLNELDNDLNIGGYEQSSDIDKAIDELDKALIEVDTIEEEEKDEDDEEIDVGYKEKEVIEDEETD